MAIAMLEPALPIWMMETMCSKKWQLGKVQHVIFVHCYLSDGSLHADSVMLLLLFAVVLLQKAL